MGAPQFTQFVPPREHWLLRSGLVPSRFRAFLARLGGGEMLWVATWHAHVTSGTWREYVAVGVYSADGRERREADEREVAWAFEFMELRLNTFDEAVDGEHRIDAERVMKFVREQPSSPTPRPEDEER